MNATYQDRWIDDTIMTIRAIQQAERSYLTIPPEDDDDLDEDLDERNTNRVSLIGCLAGGFIFVAFCLVLSIILIYAISTLS
jgi:hypothetical protein